MFALCPVCNAPMDASDIVCPACRAKLDSECFDNLMSRCPTCFYPKVDNLYICTRCSSGNAEKVFPVARYDGSLSYSILYSLKFHGHKEMAPVVALYLSRALSVLDPDGTALLVPIPCSKARLNLLGWDPMVEVCKALKRPFSQLLVNTNASRTQQKRLNREQRLQAAIDRYRLNPQYEKNLPNLTTQTIIVVDDLVTTMSTMNSAIAFLRSKGFSRIFGASWLCEL